jgi:hypothetical protein
MHRVIYFCLSLALALAAVTVPGAGARAVPSQAAGANQSPIEQLSWLVGGTWTAEEPSSEGPPLRVQLTCRWSSTRNAILFEVSFSSAGRETPQYDGMYLWHPGKRRFVLWQVNRRGEVAEGELTISGKEMDQEVRVVHPDGSLHFLQAHFMRMDDNAFRFQAHFRLAENAPWQDALDIVYRRQPGS